MTKKTNIFQSIILAICMTSHLAFGATSPEDIYQSASIESSETSKSFDSYKMKKMIFGGVLALGTILALGYVYFRSGTDDNKKQDEGNNGPDEGNKKPGEGTSSILKGKQEVDQQDIESLAKILNNQEHLELIVDTESNTVNFDELQKQLSNPNQTNKKEIKEWIKKVQHDFVHEKIGEEKNCGSLSLEEIGDSLSLSGIERTIKREQSYCNNLKSSYTSCFERHPTLCTVKALREAHQVAIDKLQKAYKAAVAARKVSGKPDFKQLLEAAQEAADAFQDDWPKEPKATPQTQPQPHAKPSNEDDEEDGEEEYEKEQLISDNEQDELAKIKGQINNELNVYNGAHTSDLIKETYQKYVTTRGKDVTEVRARHLEEINAAKTAYAAALKAKGTTEYANLLKTAGDLAEKLDKNWTEKAKEF